MLYRLEQGPTEDAITEQAERQNKPLPEEIENAPELVSGLLFFMEAFTELGSCRSMGGPIPYTAIVTYAQVNDLDIGEFETLLYHVRRLDAVATKWFKENKETSDG